MPDAGRSTLRGLERALTETVHSRRGPFRTRRRPRLYCRWMTEPKAPIKDVILPLAPTEDGKGHSRTARARRSRRSGRDATDEGRATHRRETSFD